MMRFPADLDATAAAKVNATWTVCCARPVAGTKKVVMGRQRPSVPSAAAGDTVK
jgi:hypothetical protein